VGADAVSEFDTRPTCDRCNKPVERFVEEYDPILRRVVYVARCHGESERVIVAESEIVAADRWAPEFGRAFVAPKLLTGSGG
jgi:hypothetical protein